mmetsp:Transcript_27317/g.40343  ORF Transcript_27317/g.40343 Transcript_27317/m.40343 type:complete len:224 (+) Transcript_27317:856-1527(+)
MVQNKLMTDVKVVYQSVDDDKKRRRNPFDDLAKGIYRDIDFPVSSEDNLLDSFVKNAYRSNEYGMAISEYGSTHESNCHSKFEELRKYKEVHGDCKVRSGHPMLGVWAQYQCRYYRLLKEEKKAPITQERIDLLNSISFDWVIELSWMEKFEELRKHKEIHGDCKVRSTHPRLGIWVRRQRELYRLLKEGRETGIMQERIDLLNGIGFDWVVGTGRRDESSWM